MKVTSGVNESAFKPIQLTITIESKDELASLWCRFNTSQTDLIKAMEEAFPELSASDTHFIWRELNKHAGEYLK